jgi:hypothetical protein
LIRSAGDFEGRLVTVIDLESLPEAHVRLRHKKRRRITANQDPFGLEAGARRKQDASDHEQQQASRTSDQ